MAIFIETLADYVVAEGRRDLPAYVIHHAKRALIDWFAAMLPGSQIAPAKLLIAHIPNGAGRNLSTDCQHAI